MHFFNHFFGSVFCSAVCFCSLGPVSGQEEKARTLQATEAVDSVQGGSESEKQLRWWKGNLHTHSLWSDGDDFPEMIGDWYQRNGYNFLALSDHNIVSAGQRWMKFDAILKRAEPDVLEKYTKRFGREWVETRGNPGEPEFEVRLKPLDEFGPLLNRSGEFLMIPGEEISDRSEGKPVHMNATNVQELIRPVGGETVREAMQNNLRAVLEQEEKLGREILPHLNHPNFGYAVTAEDLAVVVQEQFFEVYNGHPGVNQLGDDEHQSIESMWDLANAIRVCQLDAEPLLGLATDDSHEYHNSTGATTGRGWVMVQARYLTPEHLITAMKAGDFYASSGVELESVNWNAESREYSLTIVGEPGVSYTSELIGIAKSEDDGQLPDAEQIGFVVETQAGLTPSFQLPAEIIVGRIRVSSTKKHANPSIRDQFCQAWAQPVVAK
ncbi:MAG: hypothetical protein AAF483_14585 [Planctomycetota bacterium]